MGVSFRCPFVTGLVQAILQYVLTLVGIYVVAFIIDALAPSFDSKKNMVAAMKVAVFAFTPAWIAGILGIIPCCRYLLYLHHCTASIFSMSAFPFLWKHRKRRYLGYFVVIIVVTIIVWVLISVFADGCG